MREVVGAETIRAGLQAIVGPSGIQTGRDMQAYLTDWRGRSAGTAMAVVMPASTQEVSAVLRYCADQGLPLFVQGGNTSLCGGSVPGRNGRDVLLSTRRLRAIREIDPVSNLAVVEAGVVLSRLHEVAEQNDRVFPLHLGAEGSAQIGGLISTNAGGVSGARYGSMRALVLGLEVVLPDGSIVSRLNGLRKDNRGYDWKHLFIGGEGTLGVVTAAALQLHTKMRTRSDALVAVSSPADAVRVFNRIRDRFDTKLMACELVSGTEIELTLKHVPGLRFPLAAVPDWTVMVELGDLETDGQLQASLQDTLESMLEDELIQDAALCQNLREGKELWKLRHSFSEANKMAGHGIVFDASLRVKSVPEFIARAIPAARAIAPWAVPLIVCHLGDGNVHLIAMNLKEDMGQISDLGELTERVFTEIHDIIAELDGSFSAEHGIGRKLVQEMERRQPPAELELMRRLKRAIDPDNRMAPGVLFDPAKLRQADGSP